MGGRATIGRPLANTRAYLGGTGQAPVAIGVAGELFLGGSGLARGYLDQPGLTAERFLPDALGGGDGDRVYRTGDLARWQADGNLDFLGRIDHQVKIRGFRIELGEIESALRQHPSVRDTVVLARQDHDPSLSQIDKRLVAYLVLEHEPGPATSELRAYLKERLPDYMVPAAFVTLDSLPLTPNGKVDRKALPRPDQMRHDLESTLVEPRTETEEHIASIWRDLLRVEEDRCSPGLL